MGKIFESKNGISIVGIFGIVAIVISNVWANTMTVAIENDYDVSVKMQEHGEASFTPSDKKKKKNDEQENEEQEAEEQEIEEVTT